jgi:hypothetical protein
MMTTERTHPEHALVMGFDELKRLPEYSCSMPTGTGYGKCWSRNNNAYNAKPVPWPNWWMGCYYDIGSDKEVGIQWFRVYLGQWSDETPKVPGLYLMREKGRRHEEFDRSGYDKVTIKRFAEAAGQAVHVEVRGDELWAESLEEDPDGERPWVNYFAAGLEDVEWYCIQRECNRPGCTNLAEHNFLACRPCIKKKD